MSTWRTEAIKNSDKSAARVIEAAAAKALGWSEQVVDATRLQLEYITKMQIRNDGPNDRYLGGANQIADLTVRHPVEAEVLLKFWRHRRLARRRRESIPGLYVVRGAMAKSVCRRNRLVVAIGESDRRNATDGITAGYVIAGPFFSADWR
jgi:hypothetical protein